MSYNNSVLLGDCLEVLATLPDQSVDAIVTDPPYGLGTKEPSIEDIQAYLQGSDLDTSGDFMGKNWQIPSVAVWKQCFRVLKPGGHILSFGGTRTWDLISLGLRAAGFENRDTIASLFGDSLCWIHSQGFPKSLSIDKALDKMAGAEREVTGTYRVGGNALTPTSEKGGTFGVGVPNSPSGELLVTAPATEDAKKWAGWGTALKPSFEPVLVFRKPFVESTIAKQVLATGTGGLNIDATRVRGRAQVPGSRRVYRRFDDKGDLPELEAAPAPHAGGRWPSNLVLVHHPECVQVGVQEFQAPVINRFDDGMKPFGDGAGHAYTSSGGGTASVPLYDCHPCCPARILDEQSGSTMGYGDVGASRFFPSFEGQEPPAAPFLYTGKASKKETTLDGLVDNNHPTKKPLALMEWLVKLVTPVGGIVLDPYAGSGTTCVAARYNGMNFVGIERDPEYHKIATARAGIVHAQQAVLEDQRSVFDMMAELSGD